MSEQSDIQPFENLQKRRKGFARLRHATRYSCRGLCDAWREPAFRLELAVSTGLLPFAFWLSGSWVQTAVLLMSLALVLIVELLNTGIESAIDRIGPQWHPLSRKAKDVGSAATLVALIAAGGVWSLAIFARLAAVS
ncbi:diacylglycerol kinase [Lampropedia cohaerens]|uniref:Diacylglycerol kinase n=1 Tax=Lampropedia cohaerens TaxID=1610491 RepID=A0A0U1Q1G4_9BURK|nr:diacylglycerol kinase [Lampropedia cohaerens]KKW68435.1 diacylglycerol kinase [Lampropedia cohaerens]